MAQCMLTTMDNPYNPFTHFDEWFAFDIEHQYMTTEWLGKLAKTSSLLEDEENKEEISAAIDRFLAINPYGIHFKVYDYDANTIIPLANKAFESVRDEMLTEEGG